MDLESGKKLQTKLAWEAFSPVSLFSCWVRESISDISKVKRPLMVDIYLALAWCSSL